MALPPDTIEHVQCSVPGCSTIASGTGRELSTRGWRSYGVEFGWVTGPCFYCPGCWGDDISPPLICAAPAAPTPAPEPVGPQEATLADLVRMVDQRPYDR